MFKLAAFTDEISQDFAHACDVCVEYGVPAIELRGAWETPVHKFSDEQLRDIAQILADHGLSVCSIGSPFGKCELNDTSAVAQHMDFLRRSCDIARRFDCTIVRGFAFWDRDQAPEKPWDDMLRAYDPVPHILEEKGVLLGLENEAACYVGTAEHARFFVDRLGCERVRVLWDAANHVQDPQMNGVAAYPDAYERIKDIVVHIHAKDAQRNAAGEAPNVYMGEGECGWPELFAALKREGYEGYVSLETHVDPHECPESVRARYGVHLKGEGREGASRVCLAWMKDTLAARE